MSQASRIHLPSVDVLHIVQLPLSSSSSFFLPPFLLLPPFLPSTLPLKLGPLFALFFLSLFRVENKLVENS